MCCSLLLHLEGFEKIIIWANFFLMANFALRLGLIFARLPLKLFLFFFEGGESAASTIAAHDGVWVTDDSMGPVRRSSQLAQKRIQELGNNTNHPTGLLGTLFVLAGYS